MIGVKFKVYLCNKMLTYRLSSLTKNMQSSFFPKKFELTEEICPICKINPVEIFSKVNRNLSEAQKRLCMVQILS